MTNTARVSVKTSRNVTFLSIIRVGGQPWLELEYHADRSECWQARSCAPVAESCAASLIAREKNLRKNVGFESGKAGSS